VRRRFLEAAATTFRSLHTRNFRLFFVGQLISQAGTWMQSIAIIWVVLRLTDDGVALGLATAAQFLPVLVLGAWGGVLSDRLDRHRILLVTQSLYTMVAVAFTILTFSDVINMPLIYALSTAFGLVTAIDNPTRRAFVVEMVSEENVPNAVGLNSTLMTGSRVLGPALAGVLITTVGVAWCFAGNVLTYFAVLGALLAMDRTALRTPPRVPRAAGQLRAGLRYVWDTGVLRYTLVLLAVVGTLAFEFQVTLPLLADRTFGGGAGTFTLLYSSLSVGAVAGGLIMAHRSSVDAPFLARSALWMAGFMAVLTLAPNIWVALAAVIPIGLTSVLLVSGSNALIQLEADPSMRGRALALTTVVFLGSTPIGGPVVGAAAEHIGARAGVGIGAVATGVAAVWALRKILRMSPTEAHRADTASEVPAVARG
jgi:MFS family permease